MNNGAKLLTEEKFSPVQQSAAAMHTKPTCGLFCCPVEREGKTISAWQRFCLSERFNYENVVTDAVMFEIRVDAKTALVDSLSDYNNLLSVYGTLTSLGNTVIDWERLSLDFDFFYLTRKGLTECYELLPGWDVPTGIVLNFSAIGEQHHEKLNPFDFLGALDAEIALHPDTPVLVHYELDGVCEGEVFTKSAWKFLFVLIHENESILSRKYHNQGVYAIGRDVVISFTTTSGKNVMGPVCEMGFID